MAGRWVTISEKRSASQLRIGSDGNTLDLTDLMTVVVEEWVVDPEGAGGSVTTPGQSPGPQGPFANPGGAVSPGLR
jgi:hypothetical protein